jgi:hypothetical protein
MNDTNYTRTACSWALIRELAAKLGIEATDPDKVLKAVLASMRPSDQIERG